MRLHRLRAENFAGIREVEVELGPGLTVLYGPNELGKSTLVEAIRMALLLPHNSTYHEPYVGWTGGQDPVVEVTFESGPQRIWRVRKQFGRSGSSLLRESKNGRDFDDVERGRKVDARIREILPWGIPEPGGTGGGKGLPASFLVTALLPVQAEVSALLERSLQNDPTASGKDHIAAALQAIGQDPKFTALLREVQAKRDSAYTEKGHKSTAKGSVFKDAAERVNETREEKDRFQRIVNDSEGAEILLRNLTVQRSRTQEALAIAKDRAAALELLAQQAKDRGAAAEQVRVAHEEVLRIRKLGRDVQTQEREVVELARKRAEADLALKAAQSKHSEAQAALDAAEAAAREGSPDPALSDTIARQQLEMRLTSAEQAAKEAQARIEAALAVRKLVDAAAAAEREFGKQQKEADGARQSAEQAAAKEKASGEELQRCDLIERALELQAAEQQAAAAQGAVDREGLLRRRWEAAMADRDRLAEQRAALLVPLPEALRPMRKLSTELAAARGALNVGLVVMVSPRFRLDLGVTKDGQEAGSTSTAEPLEVEAGAEVEVAIAGIATVRVRGGRRAAQEQAQALEDRWNIEVAPSLAAAGATDLDSLSAQAAQAQEMDAALKFKAAEIESFDTQLAPLAGAAQALREALDRVQARRTALGKVRLETLASDLKALGSDPVAGLRKRRQKALKDGDTARAGTSQASNAQTLAEERARNSRSLLDAAILARDGALAAFPEGPDAALEAARSAFAESRAEKERVAEQVAALESTIEARRKRMDAALGGARANLEKCRGAVESARNEANAALSGHASQEGRLIELRRLRDAENLASAEKEFHDATDRHALLPVPAKIVTGGDVAAAQSTAADIRLSLEAIERDIQEARGALKQVGGAVARERLRDATEAFELAELHEREIEMEYEAWKLLLEQMKEADAAQSSNLGQTLAPAIAGRFQELTQRRYETVQLTAQLGMEGVVVGGAVRSTERISVGTREQLSTLYRLALAEYLHTAVVLDDQLVQSDDSRMGWFRELLTEKSRSFQIVVFTCRPSDYLAEGAMAPKGGSIHADSEHGFIRAIDLGRAVRRG